MTLLPFIKHPHSRIDVQKHFVTRCFHGNAGSSSRARQIRDQRHLNIKPHFTRRVWSKNDGPKVCLFLNFCFLMLRFCIGVNYFIRHPSNKTL